MEFAEELSRVFTLWISSNLVTSIIVAVDPFDVNKESDTDALESSKIELVIVPGVAFSRQKYRLGQGKGYYDTFFQKIYHRRQQINLKPPVLVGVALDEQIVDNVRVEEHDYTLDHVVTPSGIV